MRKNPFDKFIKGETALQRDICNYLAYQYPDLLVHHSPNEARRTPFERYLTKIMNVSSGFPDLYIFNPKTYVALFLELKYGNNILTDNQINWLTKTLSPHNYSGVAWSFVSANILINDVFSQSTYHQSVKSFKGIWYDSGDLLPKKFLKMISENLKQN